MIHADLPTVEYYFNPELFVRRLHEHLPIESIADISAGHGGVFDYDHWTRRPLKRRVATDLFWLKPMGEDWEQHLGVDATNMHQFKDGEFDFVQCLEVLEHIPNSRKALEELCRIAKKMVFITSCDETQHWGPEQEAIEKVNPGQKYVAQPSPKDLLDLGFKVHVEHLERRQLVAWRIM